jgi:multidrug efflux pump subunit AcrA (membrane-fusion protein)
VGKEVVAVCTLERRGEPFGEAELRLLRLCCDQTVPRLDDLKRQDRWFGAKLATYARGKLAALIGFEHTWAKVLAVLVAVALALFCFLPVTYRLEAPVILKTDDVSYLTAPYDGYIAEVHARVGDELAAGDTLLVMDRSDLFLEEAALAAEQNRYQRELEKARADQALADMRISQALLEQASARLDRVRHKLSQAVIRAPAVATVVEGDQMERVGSPVSQGDILFRLGRTDEIYAELEVPEAEIHLVAPPMDGEISLASRPEETFRIDVVRAEPSAVARPEGNVFLVRCDLPEGHAAWWRPGRTGVGKLNAGDRTLLWIFTHRTVDFLRLHLWW